MSIENHRFTSGDYCQQTGVYLIYKRTPMGLAPTEYPRTVKAGDHFPPTPGPGHCFIWQGPGDQALAA